MPSPNSKQLRQMQQNMLRQLEEAQGNLATQEVEGSAGGGAVTARANGQQRITGVTIEPEVLEEGAELLGDLVLAAVNDALDRSRELAARSMESLLPSGLLPPGLR
ncbi:MAG: YbaB/EbfC family nucleoid-associated protein [Candidatus Dormiibacterota bacterium]